MWPCITCVIARAGNERFIAYLEEASDFIGTSTHAMDACLIDNETGDEISDEVDSMAWMWGSLKTAKATRAADKAQNMCVRACACVRL